MEEIKKRKIIILAFFLIILLIGILIFRDYGLSWDEGVSRDYGIANYNYITGQNNTLITHTEKYHGPAFELFLASIEKILNMKDLRTIYFMRHFFTFLLFFVSLIFFYKILKKIFKDWKISLLGVAFIFISPRIFAHAFYNSKDIPFLAVFLISIWTLIKYLEKRTIANTIIHSIICAILIDIRIIGLLVPAITILLLAINSYFDYQNNKLEIKKEITSLIFYIILLIAFIILFWPFLWQSPLHRFIDAYKEMSKYPWDRTILYMGDYINAAKMPWHYIPYNVLITTPIPYTILFIIGSLYLLFDFIKKPKEYFSKEKNIELIVFLWFFLTIFYVIFFKPILYDSWRHIYFIYPALIIIAISGTIKVFKIIKEKFNTKNAQTANIIFIGLITISLVLTTYFMIESHPYEDVYYNKIAGSNYDNIKNKFELDYWGLSYRESLEYVLKTDTRQQIKIFVTNDPGKVNADILPEQERKRIIFVQRPENAQYYISNYRWHKEEYPFGPYYYTVKVEGTKINVVYKLPERLGLA